MQTLLIVLGCVVIAAVAFWFFRRASSGSPAKQEAVSRAEKLYELGMHPAEDGVPFMYALEACRHCRKTREFLDANNIAYHYIYVDQYSGDARSALMDKVRSYNPRGSFPTMVVPGGKVVVGFREQLIREALLHDSESPA